MLYVSLYVERAILTPRNILSLYKLIFRLFDCLRALNKIGNIQRRLAWPLRKDDTHKSRKTYPFFYFMILLLGYSAASHQYVPNPNNSTPFFSSLATASISFSLSNVK